ncbi:hypothetical protein MN608_06626 [Microdochium nivale]|nr:hypothetical protein MN608_06626 [Microdochium nivale]
MSRLFNYRFSAKTIYKAYGRWPTLVEDLTVKSVPSSKPWSRPITNSNLPALDIDNEIMPAAGGSERDECVQAARTMTALVSTPRSRRASTTGGGDQLCTLR